MTQHRVSGTPNACCQVDLTNNVSQVQLTTLGAPTEQRPTTRYVVVVVVIVAVVVVRRRRRHAHCRAKCGHQV